MTSPIRSLISSGTKLWLDSIDPELVFKNREMGATGATSNPIIVADLLKSGRWDEQIKDLAQNGHSPEEIAWQMTDALVTKAEQVFLPVYNETSGNDGYVSFELDPLLEDLELGPPHEERVRRYVELGLKWSKDHPNRMIKVPATDAGIDALEELAAAGVNLNVTLIFTEAQYEKARDSVWRGAQRCQDLSTFKSVYSIFVSRLDVYSEQHCSGLDEAQGWLGIVNAKNIWKANMEFWSQKNLKLDQEIIFASTGTKKPSDPAWKYVAAFAGSDIETNPPKTNDALEASGETLSRQIDLMPANTTIDKIMQNVDFSHLEKTLMTEGLEKFASPQKDLLKLVADKVRNV